MSSSTQCFRSGAPGFTLIELSIGLTILSLLAAGALTVGGVMVEQQQFTGTNQRVADAKQALTDYFNVNGRLPCPARLNAGLTDTAFGTETDCGNTTAPSGTTRIGGGAAYNNSAIRIGTLPARTLGLRDVAMSDEYGNRLWYAVSESFTLAGNAANAAAAITIIDGAGNNIALPTTDARSPGAAFVVFSSGPGGKAAYRYQTASTIGTCANGIDVENCNNDGTFRDARFNNSASSAAFFDDIVAWVPKYLLTSSSSSTATAAPPVGAVQFNNNGFLGGSANFVWDVTNNRVGVGTNTPVSSLSVVGGLRARQGVPDSGDSSNRGYAFGADGDTGLFSPGAEANGNGTLAFFTNNNERMRITSSGLVGIGTGTSTPESTLHVNGDLLVGNIGGNTPSADGWGPKLQIGGSTSTNSDQIYFQRHNYTTDGSNLYLIVGDNSSGDAFIISAGGTNRFTFNNNGDLHVSNDLYATGYIYGTPNCRQVTGPTQWLISYATCAANEYLMTGGGWCENGGVLHVNSPDYANNRWQADCYHANLVSDMDGTARAICCRRQ